MTCGRCHQLYTALTSDLSVAGELLQMGRADGEARRADYAGACHRGPALREPVGLIFLRGIDRRRRQLDDG